MKTIIILCMTLAITLGKPDSPKYFDGEFILRIDETILKSENERTSLVKMLSDLYDYQTTKTVNVGHLAFLVLTGEDKHMTDIEHIKGVKYLERNMRGELMQQQCEQHASPDTWGLDRVDQREQLPYDDPFSDDATYTYGEYTGVEVSVYVMDTGIQVDHPQFALEDGGSRARWGIATGGGEEDTNGHGTHCAGTVGGNDVGVAKGVELIAVKVVGGVGSGTDHFIEGAEWILDDHNERREAAGEQVRSVTSISLGYNPSQAIDDSVAALAEAGVVVVVAAGNSNADACGSSPGRSDAVINVGATNVVDSSTWYTNYGSCVHLFAPGTDVWSSEPNSEMGVRSGTSMACPHVAGAAARYLSSIPDSVPTPDQVRDYLTSTATADVLSWFHEEHASTPNLLLYAPCPM